jgi:hypothetical protein
MANNDFEHEIVDPLGPDYSPEPSEEDQSGFEPYPTGDSINFINLNPSFPTILISMDFSSLNKSPRSIRDFKKDPVPESV